MCGSAGNVLPDAQTELAESRKGALEGEQGEKSVGKNVGSQDIYTRSGNAMRLSVLIRFRDGT